MDYLKFQRVNGVWQFGKTATSDLIGGILTIIACVFLTILRRDKR